MAKSKLEQIRDTNLNHANDIFVNALKAQGVDDVTALTAAEEKVTWLFDHKARVIPTIGEGKNAISARGWSDAAIVWFAREYHLLHPELGGTPVAFGDETPPVNDAVAEHADDLARRRKDARDAEERREEERRQSQDSIAVTAAEMDMERVLDPSTAF